MTSMATLYLNTSRILEAIPEAELKRVRTEYGLRRADRLTSLAAAALHQACPDNFPHGFPADTGLVTISSFGPHKTVFAMLDDILDFPEDQILPTKFTHSVHNAVTSYLGTLLGLHGPAFALTCFESPVFELLETAWTLLSSGMCRQVLALAVEERGLLTAEATQMCPAVFPAEPCEAVGVFLATSEPAPDAMRLTLDRTGQPQRQNGSPFGLPDATLAAFRDRQSFTLVP